MDPVALSRQPGWLHGHRAGAGMMRGLPLQGKLVLLLRLLACLSILVLSRTQVIGKVNNLPGVVQSCDLNFGSWTSKSRPVNALVTCPAKEHRSHQVCCLWDQAEVGSGRPAGTHTSCELRAATNLLRRKVASPVLCRTSWNVLGLPPPSLGPSMGSLWVSKVTQTLPQPPALAWPSLEPGHRQRQSGPEFTARSPHTRRAPGPLTTPGLCRQGSEPRLPCTTCLALRRGPHRGKGL